MSQTTAIDINIESKFKPHILQTPLCRMDKAKTPSPDNMTDYQSTTTKFSDHSFFDTPASLHDSQVAVPDRPQWLIKELLSLKKFHKILKQQYDQLKACQNPVAAQVVTDDVYSKIMIELLDSVGEERKGRILKMLNPENTYTVQYDSNPLDFQVKQLKKREEKAIWKTKRTVPFSRKHEEPITIQFMKPSE